MKRYLLVDLGCGTCSSIGDQIQKETGDKIIVRGLAEMEMQGLLNRAAIGWKWEPMVMEVTGDGEDVRVYVGVLMRLRLIQVLGIATSVRVMLKVYRATTPIAPLKERRTLLKYGTGVVAGLAVLGLKSMRAQAKYEIDTPGFRVSVRALSGEELREAIQEVRDSVHYSKVSQLMNKEGYTETRNGGVALLAESEGKSDGLNVTLPFTNGTEKAQVKFMRIGSDVEIGISMIRETDNDDYPTLDLYEVAPGKMKHTTSLRMTDGRIVETPVGQIANPLSDLLPFPGDMNDVQACWLCRLICAALAGQYCRITATAACYLICLPIGNVACPFICWALVYLVCQGSQSLYNCRTICRQMGYC